VKQTSVIVRSRGCLRGSSQVLRSLSFVAAPLIALMGLPRYGLAWEVVGFSKPVPPGTIVINTPQRKLYLVLTGKTAVRYPIAVPKKGREWSGRATVIGKLVNPDWVPPPPVRADHPELPYLVPFGSPNNPVGARAILLDRLPVAIHGTSRKIRRSIGTAASYGCIRMLDEDVIHLFDRVQIGTPVLKIP
jgi:lipoprotein-anchoring transpeptidase ErfK/SrfK